MKRIILTLTLAVLAFGCKSTSATDTHVDNKTERVIKGTWQIDHVTTPGSNYIKVNALQLADAKCFEGSNWKFVSNNNKGDMSLNSIGDCPSFSSPITWFINSQGQFVLKVLNAGEKAKKVRDGYVLDVANVTEDSFELIDHVDVAGKMSNVTYHFVKTGKVK